MSYNLQALGATVEHLERLTTETAEEVKNVGRVMTRMETHIETQGKQIEHGHKMLDSLVERATTKGEFSDHEERIRALEKEPADKWKGMTWLVITFFVGAILALVASRIGLGGS